MGCTGSNAMETQATCANEYEEMLKAAQAAQKGVGEVAIQKFDIEGGIGKHYKLGNNPKDKSAAKKASSSTPVLMEDGSKYLGGWKDGKKHGRGKQLFKDGTVFEGTWKEGVADGQGKLEIISNVDGELPHVFEGMIKNSNADGPGIFSYNDGSKIEGTWKNDEKNGYFVEKWADGNLFKGHYVDGKKDGLGFLMWPDKSSYVGEFKENVISGWGRYQWADDRVARSKWANGYMHGFCHFTWEDGRIYKGEYAEGKKEGWGEFFWTDGRSSAGYWKNAQLHGLNHMKRSDGAAKWMYWNAGTKERAVDSAAEREKIWKAANQVEKPKLDQLAPWLSSLPAEHMSEQDCTSLFEKFDGRFISLGENIVPPAEKEKTEKTDKKEKSK